MTNKNMGLRRLLAGTGAFALALAGTFATAQLASAAPGTDGQAPGNVAPDTTGTLYVYKHVGTTTTNPNNGTSQTISRPPLAGAKFEICNLGFNLLTEAGWTAAKAANPNTATCTDDAVALPDTDATGLTSKSELAIGAYLVRELSAPGVTAGNMAAPFIVTIPFPSKSTAGEPPVTTTTWLWDVYTYPKNTLTPGGSKEVADPTAHGLGSLVPWTITSRTLGSFNDGAPLTTYKLIDQLVSNLQYDATTSLRYQTPGGTLTTVPNPYYTITPAGPAATGGGNVVVEFTAAGLTWLNGLQAGTILEWKLTTKVIGVGVLDNKSFENTGGDDVQIDHATTDWGQAKLLKHETGNTGKTLQGAEFQVYDVNTDGTCTAPLEGSPLTVLTNTPAVGDTASTFKSDSAGIVNIPGLYVGKDGDPENRDYCVVETVPPSGYALNATPILIKVVPGPVADANAVPVANVPKDGPDLPLTGAQGTIAMSIGGLLLVGAGVAVALVSRRRNNAAA